MPDVKGQVVRGFKDVISQPLYDTLNFANADVGDKIFFTQPISSNKTLFETNMTVSSEISRGTKFTIHGYSLAVHQAELKLADANNLLYLSKSYLEFTLLDKIYLQVPAYFLPVYNFWYTIAVTNSPVRPVNNVPYLKLARKVTIEGKQNFNIKWRIQTALTLTATVPVSIFIHGVLKRNIQ